MTEKRFVVGGDFREQIINDTINNCEYYIDGSIVNLLNELSAENEQLKKELTHKKVLLDSLQDKYQGLLKLVHGFENGSSDD